MMFWKFQANGNDFVLMERLIEGMEIPVLCHRQFGVGADGLLLVKFCNDELMYQHFNADGSDADLCVNGIRCVALWYFQHHLRTSVIVTIANERYLLRYVDDNEVMLELKLPIVVERNVYRTGVLHELVDEFPIEPLTDRNYDIVTLIGENHILVKTYERGVGPTLSCGSGMISSYYHCYLQGLVGPKGVVESKGGKATIEVGSDRIQFSSKVACVFLGMYLNN